MKFKNYGEASNDKRAIPCVQYGGDGDSMPYRMSKLFPVDGDIPEEAITVSPVYFLTEDEWNEQEGLENYYAVKGDSCIATKLQNQCEADDRVLYPIYAEIDDEDYTLREQFEDISAFLTDYLGVDAQAWYYSGNRSIHAHVNKFVDTERQLEGLATAAKQFNEEHDSALDTTIYSPKRMFRIPGVQHESHKKRKTKVVLDPHSKFEDQLDWNFINSRSHMLLPNPRVEFGDFRDDVVSLPDEFLEGPGKVTEEQVHELGIDPELEWLHEEWHYSPYGKAQDGDGRSVAAYKVIGEPYCKRDDKGAYALLPAFVYGAVGCAGDYRVIDRQCPIKLGKRDYEKMAHLREGDYVVQITGKNNQSRVLEVNRREVRDVGVIALENSREAAQSYLDERGYDVGSTGLNPGRFDKSDSPLPEDPTQSYTDAHELQTRAEKGDYGELPRNEKVSVANRLLKHMTDDEFHKWMMKNMDTYDPEITQREIDSLRKTYDYLNPEESNC